MVLDSTDPGQVRRALEDGLDRTVLVVSSKSGGTVETDSQRRAFEKAFRDAGIDPARRIVVVTDPGSPLEKTARGRRLPGGVLRRPPCRRPVLGADRVRPRAQRRWPAPTSARLLDQAAEVADLLSADDEGNPGLVLGAALGGHRARSATRSCSPTRVRGSPGSRDWAEQLIAESTGKEGKGLLPVVAEGPGAPDVTAGADDVLVVRLVERGHGRAEDDGRPSRER